VILNIIDAIVIYAQDIAGAMPICLSAKCPTLLCRDHLCEDAPAQFRSTPEYGHIADAMRAFISFLQSDLRSFLFGACLALLQGPVFAGVVSSSSENRTSEITCVDTRNS
jgi:hypothetical protein